MRWWLLMCALLVAVPARAELVYRGETSLWEDTVWQGEVLIDGILTVAPEVRLEIRPGTVVRFTFADSNGDGIGEHEIFVQGILDARGSAALPVRFTAAGKRPAPGAWGAINMMATAAGNRLEHCIVEYAYRGFHAHFGQAEIIASVFRRNLRAFQFQDSTVRISDSLIEDNFNGIQFRESAVAIDNSVIRGGQWGIRCVYSDLSMHGCLVADNRVNGLSLRDSTLTLTASRVTGNRRGVYLQRSEALLAGNLIAGQAEHGTFFEDSTVEVRGNRIAGNGRAGVRWLASRGTFTGNDLAGNGEYAAINDADPPFAAAGNWWGSADPEPVAGAIRDAADRAGVGEVTVLPALPAPPAIELPPLPAVERGD